MSAIPWMRVLPDPDQVDSQLILEWDADWQDWKIENLGAGMHRLSLQVTKSQLETARSSLGESA